MLFCKKCGSLMFPREGQWTCNKCGGKGVIDSSKKTVITENIQEKQEMLIIEEGAETLPKTKMECSKCKNMEAYWVIRQTRASDEPETRIYRCTKCGHTWREY
ncbi:MAG: transcription factor S [Candidatus Thermoplasmatota archaeon]|nr:transcription factor S [Candidatus Thermoplasmatota archaeon]